ncbi:MAG: hypothetical protein ACRDRH_19485 [Pseudonocardia sp.]
MVETLVDYACGGEGHTLRTAQNELASAVCTSAEAGLTARPESPRTSSAKTVIDQVGVVMGVDVRQCDVHELAARVPKAAVRAVRRARSAVEARAAATEGS